MWLFDLRNEQKWCWKGREGKKCHFTLKRIHFKDEFTYDTKNNSLSSERRTISEIPQGRKIVVAFVSRDYYVLCMDRVVTILVFLTVFIEKIYNTLNHKDFHSRLSRYKFFQMITVKSGNSVWYCCICHTNLLMNVATMMWN
jgi:hypothetical protein